MKNNLLVVKGLYCHCYLKKKISFLLKKWRPVALLCTYYKVLSKVFSNRLEKKFRES